MKITKFVFVPLVIALCLIPVGLIYSNYLSVDGALGFDVLILLQQIDSEAQVDLPPDVMDILRKKLGNLFGIISGILGGDLILLIPFLNFVQKLLQGLLGNAPPPVGVCLSSFFSNLTDELQVQIPLLECPIEQRWQIIEALKGTSDALLASTDQCLQAATCSPKLIDVINHVLNGLAGFVITILE